MPANPALCFRARHSAESSGSLLALTAPCECEQRGHPLFQVWAVVTCPSLTAGLVNPVELCCSGPQAQPPLLSSSRPLPSGTNIQRVNGASLGCGCPTGVCWMLWGHRGGRDPLALPCRSPSTVSRPVHLPTRTLCPCCASLHPPGPGPHRLSPWM